jgi:aryl-alcohol dehydrogenase-like predicted oxidoreductase
MQKRRLGKSEIEITVIGLGCWQFSKGGGGIGWYWQNLSQEKINAIVSASMKGGINWFDTAEAYGMGSSEKSLSTALHSLEVEPGNVVIATKWNPTLRTSKSIVNTIDQRLDCLQGYPIGLYQIHHPTSLSTVEAQMLAMVRLLREGKIRSVGVSNFFAGQVRKAHAVLKRQGFQLVSHQVPYSLLNRRIERNGILKAAQELGITIIAYSPLSQGVLTGKFHNKTESISTRPGLRKYLPKFKEKGLQRTAPLITELTAIAKAYGVSPAQIALNWLLHVHGDTVVVIPGASSVSQAEDNLNAASFKLNPKEMQSLDEISARLH